MIGVPGTSDPARTSSARWLPTLWTVKVPVPAAVRSHWASVESQSVDTSARYASLPNTLVSAPWRRQESPASTKKRPGRGQVHCVAPAPPLLEESSTVTTGSTGVVPQPRASTPESSNVQWGPGPVRKQPRIKLHPRRLFKGCRSLVRGAGTRSARGTRSGASADMTFGSLARMAIVEPPFRSRRAAVACGKAVAPDGRRWGRSHGR